MRRAFAGLSRSDVDPFVILDQMTVRKALARAGGLTAIGSQKRVQLFRNGQAVKVTLEALVQPGDVIVVGERMF